MAHRLPISGVRGIVREEEMTAKGVDAHTSMSPSFIITPRGSRSRKRGGIVRGIEGGIERRQMKKGYDSMTAPDRNNKEE